MDTLEQICIGYWSNKKGFSKAAQRGLKTESIRKAVDLVTGYLDDAAMVDDLRSQAKVWKVFNDYSLSLDGDDTCQDELELLSKIVMISKEAGVSLEMPKALLYKCHGILGKSKPAKQKEYPHESFDSFLNSFAANDAIEKSDLKSVTKALRTANVHKRKGIWNTEADRLSSRLYHRAARILRRPYSAAMMYSRSIKIMKKLADESGKSYQYGIIGTLYIEKARLLEKYTKKASEHRIIADLRTGIEFLERSRDSGNRRPVNHSMLAMAYSMLSQKTGGNIDYLIEAYENDCESIISGNATPNQKACRLRSYFNLLKAIKKTPASTVTDKSGSYLKMALIPGLLVQELTDVIEELDDLVMENPEKDFRGFKNYSGLGKILLGNMTRDSSILRKGIAILETLAEDLPPYLSKGIQHSELGEAWRAYGRLMNDPKEQCRAFISSIRHYKISLSAGKNPVQIESFIGSDFYALGSILQRPLLRGNEDKQADLSERLYNDALHYSCLAKEHGDDAPQLVSRISDIAERLAVRLIGRDELGEAAELLQRAHAYLIEPRQQENAHSHIWRARFAKQAKAIIAKDPSMSERLMQISAYTWQDAISRVFALHGEGKVELAYLGLGSTGALCLKGDVVSVSKAFIIKDYKDGTSAKTEFAINRALYECMQGTGQGFSNPLEVVPSNGKHYVIIERMPYRDIKSVIRQISRERIPKYAREGVAFIAQFHKRATEHCEKNGMALIPEGLTQGYRVPRIDYLENLVCRLITGRDEAKAEDVIMAARADKLSIREIMKRFSDRLPYSLAAMKLLANYDQISNGLDDSSLNVVLHMDMYPGNMLENGMIIDPKRPKRGNGLLDVVSFIHSPTFRSIPMADKDRFASTYIKAMTGSAELPPSYRRMMIHNAFCNIGAKIRQGKMDSVKYYIAQVLPMLLSTDNQMYDMAYDALYQSGILQIQEYLMKFDPGAGSRQPVHKRLNIGIDFDGVIADASDLKIREFKNKGYNLGRADCTKEGAIQKGIDSGLYDEVIGKLYSTSLEMRLNNDLRNVLLDLSSRNNISFITSRKSHQAKMAERYLKTNEVPFHSIINTSDQPKDKACKDNSIHIMIDDSASKLSGLGDTLAVLYDTPWNADEKGVLRMNNPAQLYSIVNWRRDQM